MTKMTLSALIVAAVLMTVPLAFSLDAAAAKGQGVSNPVYGKSTQDIVCGDRLCSEYPGGQAEFEKVMKGDAATEPEAIEDATVKKKAHHSWQTAAGTLVSVQDPGLGHETHQIAIILPPSDKVYKGLLSYSASEPIQLVALHGPLAEGEDRGQPIWTPDGETKFALTFVDNESQMGTWAFAGNALAVHTLNEETFTVSYSVAAGQN